MVEDRGVWLEVRVRAPSAVQEALAALLAEWGSPGTVELGDGVAAYFGPDAREEIELRLRRYREDLGAPIAWEWARRHEDEWLDAWKVHFRPTRVSDRLAICPSWETWSPGDPAVRVLRMDPGRAFGTGTHETTRLCLRLLDEQLAARGGGSFLDVGCGSGVLSIAALLLGAERAVALDVDRLAPEAARENAAANGVADRLLPLWGDLRCVRGTFPLVTANILYQVLMGLAPGLAQRTAPGGTLILSGMLDRELASARQLYARHGFTELESRQEGEWAALVLVRQ